MAVPLQIIKRGHITSGNCQIYGGLRAQFGDLEDDKNLIKFFQALLDKWELLEDEDRTLVLRLETEVGQPSMGITS